MMTLSPKTKALLAGGALLLVLGAAALAMLMARNVSGPLALRGAVQKTLGAAPFSLSASIRAVHATDAAKGFSATIQASGIGSASPVASQGTSDFEGNASEGGKALRASVEWRRMAPNTYLKIAPGLVLPDLPFDAEVFTDQWTVVSDTDEEGEVSSMISGLIGKMSPLAVPGCPAASVQTALASLDASTFVTVGSVLLTEVVEAPAETGMVYPLTIDPVGFDAAFANALLRAGCSSTETFQGVSALKEVTVTVGEKTGFIRGFSATTTEDDMSVHIVANLSGFGVSPTVTAPPDAIPLQQFFDEAIASTFGVTLSSDR